MNAPSSIGENWRWRLVKEQYQKIDAKYYKHLAEIYYRTNNDKKEKEKEEVVK